MTTPAGGADLVGALVALGLVDRDEQPTIEPLSGGVSSEIYLISARRGRMCAKRALPRLRVAAHWEAPVERSRYEREWLQVAARIVPGAVPDVLAYDDTGLLVMSYLAPETHRLWKSMLRDGDVRPADAAAVANMLGRIHAATADDAAIEARFPTASLFAALRLDPYFRATARAHPDCADRLDYLRLRTAATRRVLIHGDVSPKNILIGPMLPVLLDAECATFGDPAFDVAFCANHLLLKSLWNRPAAPRLLECFDVLTSTYVSFVAWEDRAGLMARVATLLPGLLLARVDGMSPVEYLDEAERELVRRIARALLADGDALTLDLLRRRWRQEALVSADG
jgi:aminoglycoside phosphotransferase (APT) family kinase protein